MTAQSAYGSYHSVDHVQWFTFEPQLYRRFVLTSVNWLVNSGEASLIIVDNYGWYSLTKVNPCWKSWKISWWFIVFDTSWYPPLIEHGWKMTTSTWTHQRHQPVAFEARLLGGCWNHGRWIYNRYSTYASTKFPKAWLNECFSHTWLRKIILVHDCQHSFTIHQAFRVLQ